MALELTMPAWAKDTIWWQVYPLGFVGAERVRDGARPPVARLRQLLGWLDYVVGLGANGLLLGPIFASESHGYDTTDYFQLDPRLGTEADFLALVEGCRARGIRLALDGVFNHVGRSFGPFQDVLRHGRASRYAGWFELDFGRGGPDGFHYADFEGHRHLVKLAHGNPEVVELVAGVMRHWCARGVDGWRMDAAYAVPPDFWRGVLERVRTGHQPWTFGELIHGDAAAYVRASGLDTLTQYELWKAIWSGLNDRNLFELAHALQRHDALLPTFLPQTFVGNHDVTRIASRLTDPRLLPHALAVLFMVPGIPSIYAGDEQGFRGVKEERAGGDDAIRPAFPATPAELSALGAPILALHRELIALRKRHPWIPGARLRKPTTLRNEQVLLTVEGEGRALTLALNLASAEVALPAPGADVRVEAGQATLREAAVVLPAQGWAILGHGI